MGEHVQFIEIQIGALVLYVFLFCCFLGPVKERAVKQFRTMLLTCIMWVGGSLCMRMQLMPGMKFWYHISIVGICLLIACYYGIITTLVGRYSRIKTGLVFGAAIVLNTWNILTEMILAPPKVVVTEAGIQYLYHTDEGFLLMAIPMAIVIGDLMREVFLAWKIDHDIFRQMQLLEIGLGLILAGNMAALIPGNTFPFDVTAGLISSILIVGLLYQGQFFEISERMLTGVIYSFSLLVAVLPSFFTSTFIMEMTGGEVIQSRVLSVVMIGMVLLAFWMAFVLVGASILLQHYTNQRERELQETVNTFQTRINASFNVDEICNILMDTMRSILGSPGAVMQIYEPGRGTSRVYGSGTLKRVSVSATEYPMVMEHIRRMGECFFTKKKVEHRHLKTDSRLEKWTEEHHIGSMGCLVHDRDLLGYVFLQEGSRSKITMSRDRYLSVICNSVSSALRNAFLYQQVYKDAITDDMTGLYNRRYVIQQIARIDAARGSVGILHLDLDEFRMYNELYGTIEGDNLLRWCAEILQNITPQDAKVCRYGSNEFVVLLTENNVDTICEIGKSVMKTLSDETGRSNKHVHYVTMSGGVSACPRLASTAREALHQVEAATRHAKSHGKNQIIIYNQNDDNESYSAYEEVAPTIYALTAAIDAKDSYTFVHVQKVADYATALARALGYNKENVEIIRQAALLHDVGKISIPEYILKKKGRLTEEEYEIMKKHVVNSIDIVHYLPGMDYVIPAVIGHHERYDGKGYPRQIAGEEIPEFARILAIADSFDAITAKRSYKDEQPVTYAIEELQRCRGTQFDPHMTDVFIKLIQDGVISIGPQDILERQQKVASSEGK